MEATIEAINTAVQVISGTGDPAKRNHAAFTALIMSTRGSRPVLKQLTFNLSPQV